MRLTSRASVLLLPLLFYCLSFAPPRAPAQLGRLRGDVNYEIIAASREWQAVETQLRGWAAARRETYEARLPAVQRASAELGRAGSGTLLFRPSKQAAAAQKAAIASFRALPALERAAFGERLPLLARYVVRLPRDTRGVYASALRAVAEQDEALPRDFALEDSRAFALLASISQDRALLARDAAAKEKRGEGPAVPSCPHPDTDCDVLVRAVARSDSGAVSFPPGYYGYAHWKPCRSCAEETQTSAQVSPDAHVCVAAGWWKFNTYPLKSRSNGAVSHGPDTARLEVFRNQQVDAATP